MLGRAPARNPEIQVDTPSPCLDLVPTVAPPRDTIAPMRDFKPNPGSFLPFLEYSQRHKTSLHSAPGSPLALLEILFRQNPPSLPLFDLQTREGMDPSRYAEALKSLRNAGYITFEGEAPEKLVHLTPRGAEVVRLARPA